MIDAVKLELKTLFVGNRNHLTTTPIHQINVLTILYLCNIQFNYNSPKVYLFPNSKLVGFLFLTKCSNIRGY